MPGHRARLEAVRVDLMGIGEFARRSRLSQKALRLYAELGLLPPTRVDADSGYRSYGADQLEVAHLVAAPRQIGVPLADIKVIISLQSEEAAKEIVDYWAGVELDLAARGQLANRLVDPLNGKRYVMYEVTTRELPARSVLCLKRHVDGGREPGSSARSSWAS